MASAPSAKELAWFYEGFRQSARPGRSQSVLALRSVEWTYEREPFLYTLLFSTFQWSSFKTLQRYLSPAVLYFLSVSLTLSFSFLSYTGDGFVANPSSISSYWLVAVTGQLWKTIACLSLSLSLSERNNLLHEGSVGSQWTLNSVAIKQ